MLYLDDFIKYLLAEKRYSELTAKAYGDDIAQFAEYLGADNPAVISTDDLRDWIVHLTGDRKLAASSVNRKLSSVKAFFRYLCKNGIIENDPFVKITSLKKPKRLPSFVEESRMEPLAERLLEPSDDFPTERDSLVVLLFYGTGIRLAELESIRTSDFSDDFNRLKIRGKGDKERIIPVNRQLRAKILHYIALVRDLNICNTADFSLILNQKGGPASRSEIYRVVRETLKSAGVQGKSSPHVLRHTFATHLLGGEADIRSIQELLGHSSLTATQVYTHNSIEQLKSAYRKAHPRAKKI